MFDKVEYGKAEIVPLPRISGPSILEQFLEEDELRDLLPE
jgi:hypothetical protein